MPVNEAQLLKYMRLGRIPVGLLLNLDSATLKNGSRRLQLAPQSRCLSASL
jgi:hypothetical protein